MDDSEICDLEVRGTTCRMGKNEGLDTEVAVKNHAAGSEHVRGTIDVRELKMA